MALTRIKSSDVVVTPTGNVAATNTQAAIAEIDFEKQVSLVSGTNIKTVGGISLLGSGDIAAGSGSGGQVITGNVTLTSSSGAAISVTPSSPGLYATLPDATTCSKSDNTFAIYNAGDYDYGVKDSAGTQLGWVRPRTGSLIGLADNTTSAGVWSPYGLEKIGVTAELVSTTITASACIPIEVDNNRVCFVVGGGSSWNVVVFDKSSATWGTAVYIGAYSSGFGGACLSATNQVLVGICTASTTLSTMTLTLTGTSINVNSVVTTTTSAAIGGSNAINNLIPVGSSFVISYTSGGAPEIRAISISGTAPTIGAASALNNSGTGNYPARLYSSGSVVRTILAFNGITASCKPFTVSGSFLAAGTELTYSTYYDGTAIFQNSSGNLVLQYHTAASPSAVVIGILKLTGTVEALTTVTLANTSGSTSPSVDMYPLGSNKVLVAFTGDNSVNCYSCIITDTLGTVSAGSVVTTNSGSASHISHTYCAPPDINGIQPVFVSANNGTRVVRITFDVSGSAPVRVYSNVISANTNLNINIPTQGQPGFSYKTGAVTTSGITRHIGYGTSCGTTSSPNRFTISNPITGDIYTYIPSSSLSKTWGYNQYRNYPIIQIEAA